MKKIEQYQKSEKQLIKTLCRYRERLLHLERLLCERQEQLQEKDREIASLTNRYDCKIEILKQKLQEHEVTSRQTENKWQQARMETAKAKQSQTIELEIDFQNMSRAYQISHNQKTPLLVCLAEELPSDQTPYVIQDQALTTAELTSDMHILVEFV